MTEIKTQIYKILESKPEYTWNYTECTPEGVNAVIDYLRGLVGIEWEYEFLSHPDELGAACAISWIENNELQLIVLSQRCAEGM